MTRSKLLALAGAMLAGWLGLAHAQEPYPSRLVTIIAPITPGTAIDIMARLYADKLSKRFGQQVVVANRAGAGGMIGAQAAATAPGARLTLRASASGGATIRSETARRGRTGACAS